MTLGMKAGVMEGAETIFGMQWQDKYLRSSNFYDVRVDAL
jgi:hypothetical protein